jgi:hypothetical protein
MPKKSKNSKQAPGEPRNLPGPSSNPATNLLIASVGLRAANLIARQSMEKGLLRMRFRPETAHQIVAGRSMGQTLITAALARLATRSIPGALVVTGGLLAKSILDRSLSRRESERQGDRELEEQAENAD